MQYQHGHPLTGRKPVEKFYPLCYNTSQKRPKAVVEISENEIAKIFECVSCPVCGGCGGVLGGQSVQDTAAVVGGDGLLHKGLELFLGQRDGVGQQLLDKPTLPPASLGVTAQYQWKSSLAYAIMRP